MKVLVGGLLQQQRRHLEDCCPSNVDLRFVGSDKEPTIWASAAKNCDVCVLVTSFCSHKHEHAVRSVTSNIVRHPGGMKGLKALIQSISTGAQS